MAEGLIMGKEKGKKEKKSSEKRTVRSESSDGLVKISEKATKK